MGRETGEGAPRGTPRKILELMYYREMSQREIAQATGIPLGTVKTRAGLAVRRLRQVLAA